MNEMLGLAPDFPDPFVRQGPGLFQMRHEHMPDFRGSRQQRQAAGAGLGAHIGKFAINIELKLAVGKDAYAVVKASDVMIGID